MVKNTQTIRRLLPTNCLIVFDHFVGLALKGLSFVKIAVYLTHFQTMFYLWAKQVVGFYFST